MTAFALHTPATAPGTSAERLAVIERMYGFIPNVFAVLAESPAVLEGFQSLHDSFGKGSFTATEREVVLISTSIENGCTFCVAAHTALARKQGIPDAVIQALRDGRPLPDAKLNALYRFTRVMTANRGTVSQLEIDAFLAAGYDNRAMLDVVLGVALMVISNYGNRLAGTPLNDAFKPFVWAGCGRIME